MADKLTVNELENVSGGGNCKGSGNCDNCNASLADSIYWTCDYTHKVIGKEEPIKESFKLCEACAALVKNDPDYSNWKRHLGD